MKREELLEELRIAVDVLLDDGYMREKGMVIKAIEAALTALQVEREHVTDGSACWCEPEIRYEGEHRIIVHRGKQ